MMDKEALIAQMKYIGSTARSLYGRGIRSRTARRATVRAATGQKRANLASSAIAKPKTWAFI